MYVMKENLRLFFSILWLLSLGFSFAFGLAVLVTWGSNAEYFMAALMLLVVATTGMFFTSL